MLYGLFGKIWRLDTETDVRPHLRDDNILPCPLQFTTGADDLKQVRVNVHRMVIVVVLTYSHSSTESRRTRVSIRS